MYEGELRHYADLGNRVIFAPALLTLDIDQVHIHTDLADCKVFSMAFSADFLHRQHKKSQDHVEVLNRSNSLKGLTFYGDVHSAMGFGVQGDQIMVWKVVDKKLFTLIEEKITRNEPIQLSLNVNADQRLQFKYKQGDMNWKEIALDINLKGMSLEQWDRSPRPGLHYKGDTKEDAQFSNFSLTYGRK
ncbi:MAG: hypothetical protein EOO20_10295 [Chryseobacterium sp.]|nr:MAG: hypothetical protein EOO20_10295 [Chryseobacterium sp.]